MNQTTRPHGHLYRRDGVYFSEATINGQLQAVCCKTADLKEAKQFAKGYWEERSVDDLSVHLREIASSAFAGCDLSDPRWSDAGRVHDWRNYVPEVVRAEWGNLSERERLLVVAIADEGAGKENWD